MAARCSVTSINRAGVELVDAPVLLGGGVRPGVGAETERGGVRELDRCVPARDDDRRERPGLEGPRERVAIVGIGELLRHGHRDDLDVLGQQ